MPGVNRNYFASLKHLQEEVFYSGKVDNFT